MRDNFSWAALGSSETPGLGVGGRFKMFGGFPGRSVLRDVSIECYE